MIAEHGALPATVEATTGGGGRHLYFARPESPVSNKVNLHTGIDLRGDGGFVVAPPSLHASGQRYEWKPGHSPEELSLALPPSWLLKPTQWIAVRGTVEADTPIPEGVRNNTLTSFAGAMRRRGMGKEAILAALREENAMRCNPPLPDDEVKGIAASVARYKPTDAALSVYSSRDGVLKIPGQGDPHQEAIWPDTVDGAALLRELGEFVGRYVVLPCPEAIIAISAWALSTHVFDLFEQHPFLVISSPEKRCGKTRLLEVLERVVRNPLPTAGMSEAVLFRVAGMLAPTFLIDEAQYLRNRDEKSAPIHDLLCAGNRRGKKVLRMGGPNHDKLEQFDIFCPKAIASIGKLTDIIMDRSIEITMRRRTQTEQVTRFFSAKAEAEAKPINQQIVRWIQDHKEEVRAVYLFSEQPPSFLRDREAENWAPLFALVRVADPASLPKLEEAARILASEVDGGNPSLAVQLLTDIREIFDAKKADFIPTKDLLAALETNDESPWIEIRTSRGLTAQSIAKLLKPFGITPRQTRMGESISRGYQREDFIDAWTRYLPPQPVTSVTAQSGSGLSPTSSPLHKDESNGSEKAENPHGDRIVTGVTDVDLSLGVTASSCNARSDSHLKEMVTNQPGLPQTDVQAPSEPPAPSAAPGHAASLRKARPGTVGRKRRTIIMTGQEVLKKSVEVLTK